MIRLIQRRLIIPRGDTGSFTIPILGLATSGDIAVFSVYSPLTHTTIINKEIPIINEKLTVSLEHDDTVNQLPGKYLWDIKIYHGNIKYNEDNKVDDADEINSYYAAYKLPICEIREVAKAE